MTPVRVLLVDDHRLFREGLCALFSLREELAVVGQAAEGQQALRLLQTIDVDVVLMDLHMPGMGGVEATRLVRAARPSVPVIILTTFDADEHVFAALEAGASGYLVKDLPADRMVTAILDTVAGGVVLAPSVARSVVRALHERPPKPVPEAATHTLTAREVDVLSLIVAGASNPEVCSRLGIALGTVKNHVSNILEKLDVRDRTQAALRARELGIC